MPKPNPQDPAGGKGATPDPYRELFDHQHGAANEPDADAGTLNNAAWTLLTRLHDFHTSRHANGLSKR